jgi:hypothetical protein
MAKTARATGCEESVAVPGCLVEAHRNRRRRPGDDKKLPRLMKGNKADELRHLHCGNIRRWQNNLGEGYGSQVWQRTHCFF